MSTVCVYSFADASSVTKYVDETEYNYTGTWSSSGTYVESTLDVVTYGAALYICIIDNIGDNPRRVPTRTNPAKWSVLSLLYEYQCEPTSGTNDPVAVAAYALAETGTSIAWSAYDLAQIGTNTGSAAYDLAGSAAGDAATAVSTANGAFAIAVAGTNAAAAAQATADSAFSIAVNGTNAAATLQAVADFGYYLAQVGTNTGTAAYNLAQSGSNLAQAAYTLATLLIPLQGSGTPVGVVTPAFDGQFYRDNFNVGLYQSTGTTNSEWIEWI